MLLSLYVKNFAIIDEITLDFRKSLNILSGETGSGKSILIGSLNFALGGRVSKEMIRKDAEYAYVELLFSSEQKIVESVLEQYELPKEDGQIIISRRIQTNGRSIFKVNGEPTTQTAIKALSEVLLDVHGQHEHQSLLYPKNHLQILDRFAKKQEDEVLPHLQEAYREYAYCKKALEEEEIDENHRLREMDLLEYECKEIEAAQLKIGEEDDLQEQYIRLSNQRQILEAVGSAYQRIEEQSGSVCDLISHAYKSLEHVFSYDSRLESMGQMLSDIESMTNDFCREAANYLSDFEEEDPKALERISSRLDMIRDMEQKYIKKGEKNEATLLAYLQSAKDKLQKYKDYDLFLEELHSRYKKAEAALEKHCKSLSEIRANAAGELEKQITIALKELNFLQVVFQITLRKASQMSANGADEAEFLISLNPGEPLAPLIKIASGGELSRIMLGIKSVLADKDEIESLIFDEIDTGISGRTAQKVAERLSVISKNHQVICITHLPQIASMADSHYLIEKTTDGEKTTTNVRLLNEEEMAGEIARMLGGVTITEAVLESAKEMRQLASESKKKL